jgi:hypothetical protein
VLEGEVGVQVGDEFRVARPGDLVFKPRACRTPSGTPQTRPHGRLSSPSPAGIERFFAEISPLLSPTHPSPPDEQALGAVMAKYGLEMGFGTIPMLFERHGLVPGGPPA